jgi:hypothetical protein
MIRESDSTILDIRHEGHGSSLRQTVGQ